jgi:hypothetical protein
LRHCESRYDCQPHRLVIPSLAMSLDDTLPTDLASAHALIIAQRQALSVAELRAAAAESEAQYRPLLIEKLKFTIRKLRHERFGRSSERGTLLDQLELQPPIWRRTRRKRTPRPKWPPRRQARRLTDDFRLRRESDTSRRASADTGRGRTTERLTGLLESKTLCEGGCLGANSVQPNVSAWVQR